MLDAKQNDGSVKHVMRVAFPLILSASASAVKLFTDRMMLAWHSGEAISAAFPAGVTCFAVCGIFFGIAGYSNTFVAQYTGAGKDSKTGLAIWQAIALSLFAGVFLATGVFWAKPLFRLIGHSPAVQKLEVQYFRILISFSFTLLCTFSLSSFWSGRGRTWTVMTVSSITTLINIFLNWVLIFGHFGMPKMGIIGAAIGTVACDSVGVAIYLALFLSKKNRERFGTWPHKAFDSDMFRRLIRYGLPNGIHTTLDIAAFNFFVIMIGHVGDVHAQEAGTIAFSVNLFAFFPLMGMGMAIGVVVGQFVGAGDTTHARRAVWNAYRTMLSYIAVVVAVFLLAPGFVLALFERPGDTSQAETVVLSVLFLKYISAYLLFQVGLIVCVSAIKGAGDTFFAMWVGVAMSWFTLVLPSYLVYHYNGSIRSLWSVLVGHIVVVSCVFFLRYRGGKWESMRVIEH